MLKLKKKSDFEHFRLKTNPGPAAPEGFDLFRTVKTEYQKHCL